VDAAQFQRISKALAEPKRVELLEHIAKGEGEVACASLLDEFGISQPTMSHHLHVLDVAGLIRGRREAKFCFYSLDREIWTEYLEELRRRVP
jgi:ArsR family transcriptional regulator